MELKITPVGFIIMFLIIIILGIVVIETTANSAKDINLENSSATQNFTSLFGANNTLAQSMITGLSATRKNQTWLEFDGNGDRITRGVASKFFATYDGSGDQIEYQSNRSNVTLSVWIQANSNQYGGGWNQIFSRQPMGSEGGYSFLIADNASSLAFSIGDARGTLKNCSSQFSSGDLSTGWHHIVYMENVSNLSFFVDGICVGSNATAFQKCDGSSHGVIIGQSLINSYGYTGNLTEVRIYNRSLELAEIQRINASGRSANASLNWTGLITWLPLNENQGLAVTRFNHSDF